MFVIVIKGANTQERPTNKSSVSNRVMIDLQVVRQPLSQMTYQATAKESDYSSVSDHDDHMEFPRRKETYDDGRYEGDFNLIGEREGQGTMQYFLGDISNIGFVRLFFAHCPFIMVL